VRDLASCGNGAGEKQHAGRDYVDAPRMVPPCRNYVRTELPIEDRKQPLPEAPKTLDSLSKRRSKLA
jgi:hypothetical protein